MKKIILLFLLLPFLSLGQDKEYSYVDVKPYVSALSRFHLEHHMESYVHFVIIGNHIKESALSKKDAQHKLERYFDKDLRIKFVSENNYGRMITCSQVDKDDNVIRYIYLHLAWDNKALIQSIEVEDVK
jgi:hypothetical protein